MPLHNAKATLAHRRSARTHGIARSDNHPLRASTTPLRRSRPKPSLHHVVRSLKTRRGGITELDLQCRVADPPGALSERSAPSRDRYRAATASSARSSADVSRDHVPNRITTETTRLTTASSHVQRMSTIRAPAITKPREAASAIKWRKAPRRASIRGDPSDRRTIVSATRASVSMNVTTSVAPTTRRRARSPVVRSSRSRGWRRS